MPSPALLTSAITALAADQRAAHTNAVREMLHTADGEERLAEQHQRLATLFEDLKMKKEASRMAKRSHLHRARALAAAYDLAKLLSATPGL